MSAAAVARPAISYTTQPQAVQSGVAYLQQPQQVLGALQSVSYGASQQPGVMYSTGGQQFAQGRGHTESEAVATEGAAKEREAARHAKELLAEVEAEKGKKKNNGSGDLNNLTRIKRVAAVYGSRRTLESDGYYQSAMELSRKLAEMGYVVRTGGGSGIMEAANRGAHGVDPKLSEGVSLRQITDREPPNAFITAPGGLRAEESFGARKAAIASGISAAFFYPGSTGTFDEFFDLIDVIKCGLHDTLGLDEEECVVVCVGVAFWEPLRSFHESVGLTFPEFVRIVDSAEDALWLVPRPWRLRAEKSAKVAGARAAVAGA